MSYSTEKQTSQPGIILDCQICFEEFNVRDKRPLVMDCGHSVCNYCLIQILANQNRSQRRCPFDNKELKRSLDGYPVNWCYIDIINGKYIIFIYS
jgi:hypothetical protein